eukprot:comp22454_c0_seq1/m.33748 comp22454_c0_seq1/g.33748  ORF comp22454_c0_seq1/g.33748 comp22454_c0_seq1/m.33748 type:complete len:706 (-) comp22454_c0_seq1:235-2352(-)
MEPQPTAQPAQASPVLKTVETPAQATVVDKGSPPETKVVPQVHGMSEKVYQLEEKIYDKATEKYKDATTHSTTGPMTGPTIPPYQRRASVMPDTQVPPLRIRTCTWNVGNAAPPQELLEGWLAPGSHDIIAVACQEAQYNVSKRNVLLTGMKEKLLGKGDRDSASITDAYRYPFMESVKNVLTPHNFVPIATVHLGSVGAEIGLGVFGAKSVLEKYPPSNVATETEGTGIANVGYNKGGCTVRFEIADTSLMFVSAHLAAHEGEKYLLQRNHDVWEIMKETTIEPKDLDFPFRADHCFWMGDLNYRIDPPTDLEGNPLDDVTKEHQERKWVMVNDWAHKGELAAMLKCDELQQEMAAGRVFSGFTEGEIKFRPTFKVTVGEKLVYQQKRIPAYCDRVVWHSLPGVAHRVKQLAYDSMEEFTTSDHKPVFASFNLDLVPQVPTALQIPPGTQLHLAINRITFVMNVTDKNAMANVLSNSRRVMDGDRLELTNRLEALNAAKEKVAKAASGDEAVSDLTPKDIEFFDKEISLITKELSLMDKEDQLIAMAAELKKAKPLENTGSKKDLSKALDKQTFTFTEAAGSIKLCVELTGSCVGQKRMTAMKEVTEIDTHAKFEWKAPEESMDMPICIPDLIYLQSRHVEVGLHYEFQNKQGTFAMCALPLAPAMALPLGTSHVFSGVLSKNSVSRGMAEIEYCLTAAPASAS